ncbi:MULTISPECIES: helix-turn-helix domain-containing protein [Laspinema]
MGVSRATASKIKNADLMPSNLDHDKLNALCRYLGVTPSDLLEYVPDESA